MVATTEPKTLQKAVQISGALTDEAVRNGSIKKAEKRGNVEVPRKDKNGRDDNKRNRTGNAFASTANPIGRENIGVWPKCTTYNSYHAPGGHCRTCFNCNLLGHLAKDYKGMPRNVNPVNARNLIVRACYECGSTDHVRRNYQEESFTHKEEIAPMALSDFEVKTFSKTCLKNYETLKKQCDDLLVKLNETEFKAATYKRGLAIIEAQLITYKKNEVLFSEEVAVLKREVGCKNYEINVLKSELEKVKQEKDGIDFKIEKFDKASKDLDQLGRGPNKLDLSYSGLDEFKEPEFKGYGPENSKQESNVVCEKESENSKENSDESLVEEQVEFAKPENHEKPVKKSVRYAEMYRSQSHRGIRGIGMDRTVAHDKLILLDQRSVMLGFPRMSVFFGAGNPDDFNWQIEYGLALSNYKAEIIFHEKVEGYHYRMARCFSSSSDEDMERKREAIADDVLGLVIRNRKR
ncbi:reverse transcriptase domain-containing protein [Tanacetum coccineum]